MSYRDMWGYNKLSSSERTFLHGFGSYLTKELQIVAQGVYKVLERGYEKMVEADKSTYINSTGYKKAKTEQTAKKMANSGQNDGIEDFHNQLGYWVPAKRYPGQKNYITCSTPTFKDELCYEPISRDNYVAEKALKLRHKFSDTKSLVGILFLMLSSDSPRYGDPYTRKLIEDFACNHYKDKNFSIESHLEPLREVFPNAIKKGTICLNHIPRVTDNSWVIAHLSPNNCYTTIRIKLEDHPNQKCLIGLQIGDIYQLTTDNRILSIEEELFGSLFQPDIQSTADTLTYRIVFIY